jgi:hypothetical protein
MIILDGFQWLPAGAYVVVPGPQNKQVQLLVPLLIIKIAFNLPFLRISDYYWMCMQLWLSYHHQCVVIEL